MGLRDSPPPTAEVSTILAFGTEMRGLAWRGGGESPPLALLPLKHPTPQRQPEHLLLNIAPTTPPFPPAASRVQLTHPPSLISDNFQHNCVRGHRSTFTASELASHLSASWPSPRRSLPPEVPSPGSHYLGIDLPSVPPFDCRRCQQHGPRGGSASGDGERREGQTG